MGQWQSWLWKKEGWMTGINWGLQEGKRIWFRPQHGSSKKWATGSEVYEVARVKNEGG